MVMIDNQSKSSFIEVAKGSISSFYCGFYRWGWIAAVPIRVQLFFPLSFVQYPRGNDPRSMAEKGVCYCPSPNTTVLSPFGK